MKIHWEDILIIIVLGVLFITLFLLAIHGLASESYKLDKVVDCYDGKEQIMENETCYETIKCSERIKIFNEKRCDKFIEGDLKWKKDY